MENSNNINRDKLEQQKSQMVKGSIWLAAGNLVSRILGAIYIIPWYAWMGSHANQANGLFSMGYNIYALFLLISTAGIPAAVAKQTARYNALREYNVSKKLFFTALKSMGALGLAFSVIMFLFAPLLAQASGGGSELVPVMRSLSIAVLVFPCMSVIRGFFQGNNQMAPSAISQVVEQIARVFYMLLSAYIIMQVQKGNYVDAVVQSTFAAFIGMIASFGVLIYFLAKERRVQRALELEHGVNNLQIQTKDLFTETIRQAIPFIIVGSGVQIFKLIDQFSFSNIMGLFSNYSSDQLLNLFSLFSSNPDKLTMIIVALATSISGTAIPLITENFTVGRKRELATLVANNIQLFFFVMLPSVVGMMVLCVPLYTIFYQPDSLGSNLLAWSAAQSLLFGYYMLACNMLQGMYQNRIAIKCLGIGIVIKLIVQFPCIYFFEIYGPILATFFGFGVSCFLATRYVKQYSHVNMKLVYRRVLLLLIMTLLMAIVTLLSKLLFGLFLDEGHKITAFILTLVVALLGGGVYAYFSIATKIADKLLGNKIDGIRRRFSKLVPAKK